jgi:hypothetical protein
MSATRTFLSRCSRSALARSTLAVSALALSSLAFALPAAALDCGTRLVTLGDGQGYVRSICGEPESISTHTESHTNFAGVTVRDGRAFYGSASTVSVQIDVWVYDFGRTRFMEEMTFANGVLRSSRALSYGTVRGDRRRRDSLEREGSLLLRMPALPGSPAILPGRRDVLTRA